MFPYPSLSQGENKEVTWGLLGGSVIENYFEDAEEEKFRFIGKTSSWYNTYIQKAKKFAESAPQSKIFCVKKCVNLNNKNREKQRKNEKNRENLVVLRVLRL